MCTEQVKFLMLKEKKKMCNLCYWNSYHLPPVFSHLSPSNKINRSYNLFSARLCKLFCEEKVSDITRQHNADGSLHVDYLYCKVYLVLCSKLFYAKVLSTEPTNLGLFVVMTLILYTDSNFTGLEYLRPNLPPLSSLPFPHCSSI